VRETGQQGHLLAIIDDLEALAGADRDTLAGLRGRLRAGRLRVIVTGEAKRGKSTLVNALLGREILPAGATPLTAVATTVTHGPGEQAEIVFGDGHREHVPLAELSDFVTERGNPGNRRGVARVTVGVDAPILARGTELVDTPGTGSVHEHSTAVAGSALATMDAAVFVLTADPPMSASERDLLARVTSLSVARFVVLNKADYLDDASLAEVLEFTAGLVADVTGEPARIYPLSARAALTAAADVGFAKFAADFGGYLESRRDTDLRQSVAGQLRRLTESWLDEVVLARRAARMRGSEAAERVAAFSARLDAVRERAQDAGDLVAAESRRMLTELDHAAERETARLAAALAAEAGRLLDDELSAAKAAAIEREGRARLAGLTKTAAETWRQERGSRLEQGLNRLDARLAGDLDRELDAVRARAAELLGLALTVPSPGHHLAPELGFFYTLREDAGQTELLAGVLRRHLPGGSGRRRAGEYLRREARHLADSQIGRARADLQYRLAESTRGLTRAVRLRYDDSTGRLQAALRTAATLRQVSEREAGLRDQELGSREAALRTVAARLSADAGPGPLPPVADL
jgi:GTP-binding protein EngB required for normal cell division